MACTLYLHKSLQAECVFIASVYSCVAIPRAAAHLSAEVAPQELVSQHSPACVDTPNLGIHLHGEVGLKTHTYTECICC